MSFSRFLRFFSNPFSITSSTSSAPEKEESSSNSNEPKKEESSSNSKIMVSTSTSSIALLGVMLMASSTFIYYLYSRAPSSNSSVPKKEESSSNLSEPKKEESSSNSSEPKNEESSSNSSIQKRFKYDVFLSFRGEDTRKNFVDHLYHALKDKGIYTYKDDEKIQKGERISDDLFKSIEDSKFYIIVFSKNYASSSWCLEELVKIMECHKMPGHTVYPVFYDVEPTEVRNQSGAVGKAFFNNKKKEAAEKWKGALKEAADLAGWELKNTLDGHEAKFIKKIVHEISLQLRSINFGFDEKLVGMKTRVEEIVSSLEVGADEIRMIGIKGMGGAGKTTTARAVFYHLSADFEAKVFVENVREASKASGLKNLQEKILSKVLNEQVTLDCVDDGKNMMKRRMCGKKVLLVLDDVDHLDQLEVLAGEPNWFKPGSRIMITTRDEQVLVAHRVNVMLEFYHYMIHDIALLSEPEAICLFSRYAFGTENPLQGNKELSKKVVSYAAGLPLTLKVLGSFLCGRDKDEWEDAIERLKTIPLEETREKLELSYISLAVDYKKIFLDIACILKGERREYAIRVLECCGFHAKTALKVLEQRSLITVDEDGFLGMHDHIEEMGKHIVRHEHPNEPNKHSRLWISEEIEDILANDKGTKETRCLKFYMPTGNVRNFMKGLGKMKELRYLELNFVLDFASERDDACLGSDMRFVDTNQCFTNSLNYLKCTDYPFLYLPKTFQAKNLVGLEMESSRMVQLWEEGEKKDLKNLKFLSLSLSNLTTFDFRVTPNLESLSLKSSSKLKELCMPDTCQKLKHLEISESRLRSFDLRLTPNLETLSLESSDKLELCIPVSCQKLKYLSISHSKLRTFDLGLTPNLETLSLSGCADFVELKVSVACPNLKFLNLCKSRLRSLDLDLIPNLERIDLRGCDELVEINAPVGCLKKVGYLNLSGCLRFTDFVFRSRSEPKVDCYSATLDLVGVSIDSCPLHPNSNLPKLRFRCSYKEYLPSSVGNIEKLISFGLCACTDLQKISAIICSLQWLTRLKLKYNIPEFPKDLGKLQCLEELRLYSTMTKHLPDSICMLKRLKSLKVKNSYLFGDLLEKLPEDLGQLECLERLHVSSKKIEYLPDSLCMLKCLKSLDVTDCCRLGKFPEDIGQLESLERLDLSSTEIKHLPDSICMLKHLKYLDLHFCRLLEKLPEDLGRLECLKGLDITYTGISHLPQSIFELKGLLIAAPRELLQLYDFPSDIETTTSPIWHGIDEKLVGMETRVKDVVSSLEVGADEVCMIGIKGMGGAGKTTTARAVFDHLSADFEAKSFVENVREASRASMLGLKSLQEQVLSKVLNERVTLDSVNDGKNMMKRRMWSKKVLLVLDDVDDIEQLEALAGEPKWFKPGSRIIVTTRDVQVLVAHRVNVIRDIALFSKQEAICLFSRYAFGREIPSQGYEELSENVVLYAAGLPLTLKVLGSFLHGKDMVEWVDAIERLKRIPLRETHEKLELCFLEDEYREILLDIACILKGKHKKDAIRVLECCGFPARNGLKFLEQRSLITISKGGYLGMHNHIEEIGKYIVRRFDRDEPNKHSRLWIHEEIEDILANDMGTEETRCLKLDMPRGDSRILMKGFGKMKKLRYLDVEFAYYGNWEKFDDTSQLDIPNSLKYLRCLDYPFLYLPKTFQANNLVGLEMKFSRRMVQLWEEGENKVLTNLKFLSLSYSNLTTFDFNITPNLETLSLENSYNLVELRMPVTCQKLNHLHITYSKLRTFDLGLTPNLEKLSLNDCAHFEELHVSVACPNLKFLDLHRSRLRSLDLELIPNLEWLNLDNCNQLVEINAPVECLKKVVHINLSGCALLDITDTGLSHLPQSIFGIKGLLIAAPPQLYDFPSEIKTTTSSIWRSTGSSSGGSTNSDCGSTNSDCGSTNSDCGSTNLD